jgi:predicted enzyme related to lactoylglutathione lyase
MPNIDLHSFGSFCWIELATTDQHAAKNFYGSLFGWAANDLPMRPGAFYTMFQLDGHGVGAAYTLRPDQLAKQIPPHWMLYVLVENADATADRIAKAGGTILQPPCDAMDVGRMAIIKDPTGAPFCIWQAKKSRGTLLVGEPGALCWADLNSPDPARARRFYGDVFDWKFTADTHSDPPSGYLHIQNGRDFIGGIPPLRPESAHIPPHWLSYFQVADCETAAAKAKALGAKVFLEPFTMEDVGSFAILDDPSGAAFAIFQPLPKF